jgi:hypothetical protein
MISFYIEHINLFAGARKRGEQANFSHEGTRRKEKKWYQWEIPF